MSVNLYLTVSWNAALYYVHIHVHVIKMMMMMMTDDEVDDDDDDDENSKWWW